MLYEGLPSWLSGKEPARNAGDLGSIPGSGRRPGGGHGNPLPNSGLENPADGGSDTTEGSKQQQQLLNEALFRLLP